MKNAFKLVVTLVAVLLFNSPIFACTIVDTTQIQGFTKIMEDGTVTGITEIIYYTPEETILLENGVALADFNVEYIYGEDAILYLTEKGIITPARHTTKREARSNKIQPFSFREEITQYYDEAPNLTIYPFLKSTVISEDGRNWRYSRIHSMGVETYGNITHVSSSITSGGAGSSSCVTTNRMRDSDNRSFDVKGYFYARDF